MNTAECLTTGRAWFWRCALALSLSACGGGGGDLAQAPNVDPTPTPVDPTPTPAPFDPAVTLALLSEPESLWIADAPGTYSAQDDAAVLHGTVFTRDTATTTFADVNADIDDTDLLVPEIPAHIMLDGMAPDTFSPTNLTMNATIRLRGHSSRLAPQKSYRIKLTGSNVWRAEQTLQFNKQPWDLTRVRNKLAMDLFRTIPHMPSLRTQFVQLDVTNLNASGVPYASGDFGLFTHVEKMGKEYLANRGLPTAAPPPTKPYPVTTIGNIYKAEDFSFRADPALALTSTGAAADKAVFETVLSLEADNKDHTKLIAMVTAVSDESTDFDVVFTRYFERANYLTWLATSILMGNRDTINQNFALYQPVGTDKFFFLPWDYDGALGWDEQPDVLVADKLYAPWQKSVGNWWGVPLHRRFIRLHLDEVKAAVEHIYTNHLTEAKLQTLLDGYKPLVQPRVSAVPDVDHLPTTTGAGLTQWNAEYERLKATPARNRQLFRDGLDAPMPFFTDMNPTTGGLLITWEEAVDLQGDAVTYTVALGSAPDALSVVATGVTGTELAIPARAPGQYYLRVTARDAGGHVQQSFDRTLVGETAYFGVRTVTVP
jgi:spore coat protein H